jgi:hypothetical protein
MLVAPIVVDICIISSRGPPPHAAIANAVIETPTLALRHGAIASHPIIRDTLPADLGELPR